MIEMAKVIADVCPTLCPDLIPLGKQLMDESSAFQVDFVNSLELTTTVDEQGNPYFTPPIAQVGYAPYGTMIESTVAMYDNFRYANELLSADTLPAAYQLAKMKFRESHTGAVSGIT
jgi:hypothetical protein